MQLRSDLDSLLASLTPREREIVLYVATGRANKVIAIDLGISLRTAEAHRAHIFEKLGVRNAMQLACRLCEHWRAGASPLLRHPDAPRFALALPVRPPPPLRPIPPVLVRALSVRPPRRPGTVARSGNAQARQKAGLSSQPGSRDSCPSRSAVAGGAQGHCGAAALASSSIGSRSGWRVRL